MKKNESNASNRIPPDKIESVFSKVLISKNIINKDDTSAVFIDLSFLKNRINELKKAFPKSTIHTAAIKANPLPKILNFVKSQGLGFEAASLPELYTARKTGISSNKILFDSLSKTIIELEYALKAGVYVNADSLNELERIDFILNKIKSKSKIGLRINPQVGTGRIKITSVAGSYSKFGVPILERRKEIIKAYQKYNWLCGIHLHIGSQGCILPQLVKGTNLVYNLAEEINSNSISKNKIRYFDIGGGLPVSYLSTKKEITFNQYAISLKRNCPELFTGRYSLITEFGRHIFANSAWAVSRIEYIKNESNLPDDQGGIKTLMIHLGADMFIRESYNQTEWPHEFLVLNKKGRIIKSRKKSQFTIAGPLCFAGDLIGRNVELPKPSQNDFLIIRDVGAYTFSMWSRYNSRQMPKILGYLLDGKYFNFLKNRETLEDVRNFWI